MFTELLEEALAGMLDGIDDELAGILLDFVGFGDEIGVGFADHGVQNVLHDILSGPLCDAIGRTERLEPGSGNALNGVRKILVLAKRFNFNVEAYEERLNV
jgi:hypothetical protein